MKSKQIFPLATCLLFVFIVAGCGEVKKVKNTNNNSTSPTVTTTKIKPTKTTAQIAKPTQPVKTVAPAPKQKTFAQLKREAQPSKYLTFTSIVYGYSFIYPDNWKKTTVINKATPINMTSPNGGASLNLTCTDFTKLEGYENAATEVNDIAILSTKMEPQLIKAVEGYQGISKIITTQNGSKVVKRVYKGLMKGIPIKATQTSMVKNGTNCVVTYLAQESVYDLYKDIAARSSASLIAK
jgi:hypothetical protein